MTANGKGNVVRGVTINGSTGGRGEAPVGMDLVPDVGSEAGPGAPWGLAGGDIWVVPPPQPSCEILKMLGGQILRPFEFEGKPNTQR